MSQYIVKKKAAYPTELTEMQRRFCEYLIMNEGRIIEKGNCKEVLTSPKHDYTKHLLSCVPEWMK